MKLQVDRSCSSKNICIVEDTSRQVKQPSSGPVLDNMKVGGLYYFSELIVSRLGRLARSLHHMPLNLKKGFHD